MIPSNKSIESNETATTLLMEDLQLTDAGVYECVFNHTIDGWILRRTINLDVTGVFYIDDHTWLIKCDDNIFNPQTPENLVCVL